MLTVLFEELRGKSSLQSPSLELSYPLSVSVFKQLSPMDLATELFEEAVSCGVSVLVAVVFLLLFVVSSCVSSIVPIS